MGGRTTHEADWACFYTMEQRWRQMALCRAEQRGFWEVNSRLFLLRIPWACEGRGAGGDAGADGRSSTSIRENCLECGKVRNFVGESGCVLLDFVLSGRVRRTR